MELTILVNEQKVERVIPAYISRPRNKKIRVTVVDKDIVEQIIKINGVEVEIQKYVVDGDAKINKKITAVSTLDFVEENDTEAIIEIEK